MTDALHPGTLLCPAAALQPAPDAPRRPMTRRLHGRVWQDDYSWMRPDGAQPGASGLSDLPADLRDFMERQNRHYVEYVNSKEDQYDAVSNELMATFSVDDGPVVVPSGPYDYFLDLFQRRPRSAQGLGERIAAWQRELPDPQDRLLPAIFPDREHRRIVYAFGRANERYSLRIRDTAGGQDLPDLVPDAAFLVESQSPDNVVWMADGGGFLYVRRDAVGRHASVCWHRLGTPATEDEPLFVEASPAPHVSLYAAGDYAIISSLIDGGGASNALWLVRTAESRPRLELLQRRSGGVESACVARGRDLYLLTNRDAPDFRIVRVDPDDPRPERWREVVPHRPGRHVDWCAVRGGCLARCEWRDAQPTLVLHELATGAEREVAPLLGEPHGIVLAERPVVPDELVVKVESLRTPPLYLAVDLAGGAHRVLMRSTVAPEVGLDDLETVRREATGHDGVSIPVTILARRDLPRDGRAIAIVYAYGAYGVPLALGFERRLVSLAARGFVIAYAHVRGGRERGAAWHSAGRGTSRSNTVLDLVSVAGWLVAERYSDAGRIIAHGTSAGGLTVTAAANMSPDLFSAVVAQVPFVDLVEDLLDDAPGHLSGQREEFGNPMRDAATLAALQMISPYDGIRPQCYPAILVTGDLADARVPFWGPLRYAARLRATMTGGGPVFSYTYAGRGHFGSSHADGVLATAVLLTMDRLGLPLPARRPDGAAAPGPPR